MRKTILAALLVLAMVIAARPAFAGKVGFVDLSKVLELTKMGQEISRKIAARTDELKIKVKKAELKVVTLRDALKRTESALSDEAKKKKYEELNNALQEYQQIAQQAMMDIEQFKLTLFKELISKVKVVTSKLAASNGYDLVLLKVEDVMTEGSVVLYGSSSVDLTDLVIRQMNAQ